MQEPGTTRWDPPIPEAGRLRPSPEGGRRGAGEGGILRPPEALGRCFLVSGRNQCDLACSLRCAEWVWIVLCAKREVSLSDVCN